MNYKKYFFALLCFPFVLLLVLAMYILYDDTLQIFPKGYFIEEKFTKKMREQNKGIIDNVDFQSAFLGTSMLENSSALEASTLLGETFVNISVAGSNFYERSFILNYLLKKKEVRSLVYSLDYDFVDKNSIRPKGAIWPELYSENISDLIMYYYDMELIKHTLQDLLSFSSTKASIDFFDSPVEWATNTYYSCTFGGLENWILNIDKHGTKSFLTQELPSILNKGLDAPINSKYDEKERDDVVEYINKYIIKFVKEYPNTVFHIIIPPYYRYRYAEMRQVGGTRFALYQEIIRHLVQMSAQYPNLKVYGFEDMPFLDDIANYRDTGHYHQSINSMMNHAIADGTHVLTLENIESYLAKCDALAQAFDIQKLYDDACALMVKHGLDPKTGERVH